MISIIVPVYKVEPYLRQCVDSILGQTYRDIEVLLIDDGSPDRCGEICDEYGAKDQRVRVFHTENRGLSAARNLGLREAKGEYIGFVDSDDWIEPDMYEVLLRRMQETGADIGVCGAWEEFPTTSKELILKDAVYSGAESLEALIDEDINDYAWNKLYRYQLFQDVLFPRGLNYEDITIMHKVIHKAEIVVVDHSLKYHYRQRSESITDKYTPRNILHFARAHISRYLWFRNNEYGLFKRKQRQLLLFIAKGFSRVWQSYLKDSKISS